MVQLVKLKYKRLYFKKNILKAEEVAEERRAFHQRLEERRGRVDSLDSSSIRQDICQQLYS